MKEGALQRGLLEAARELERLAASTGPMGGSGPAGGVDFRDLRERLRLYLKAKAIPELESPLPLLVAIQGGTNTGKSTVFNALHGRLLSPAPVEASATKHPLVLAHTRWRERFLFGRPLAGFECLELRDPRDLISEPERTERLYVRFHNDDRLGSVALIDSPDLDGYLATNRTVARRISVLSDLVVFVTTAEKYADALLVEELRHLCRLKCGVLVVFNRVDDEVVYATLRDDLARMLETPGGPRSLPALKLPHARAPHPEEELGPYLRKAILEQVLPAAVAEAKAAVLERTLRQTAEAGDALALLFAGEGDVRDRILLHLEGECKAAVRRYAEDFHLAFPEETLALWRILRATELFSLLVRDGRGTKGGVVAALLRCGEAARRFLLRLATRDQGAIDDAPEAVEEYREARDREDLRTLLRLAGDILRSTEALLRREETASPLAREFLASEFTAERHLERESRVREAFARALEEYRRREQVLERVERWERNHPEAVAALRVGCVLFKTACGAGLASLLWPAGFFSVLNWVYFLAGYWLGAYGIAFTAGLLIQRRRRFERYRTRGARKILEEAVLEPLKASAEKLLPRDSAARVRRLSDSIASGARGGSALRKMFEGVEAGPAPPSRTGAGGKRAPP